MEHLEFMECDSCKGKPGTPSLCQSCVHNRDVIAKLKMENKEDIEWMTKELLEQCGEQARYISHDNNVNVLFYSEKKANMTVYYQMDIVTDCDNAMYLENKKVIRKDLSFIDKYVFENILSFIENKNKCTCDLEAYQGRHSLRCSWSHNNELVDNLRREYKDFIDN